MEAGTLVVCFVSLAAGSSSVLLLLEVFFFFFFSWFVFSTSGLLYNLEISKQL